MSNPEFNMSMLDMSIDDIDDLPGFEVPVNGIYSLKFNTTIKQVAGNDCVEASFEVLECIEQNDQSVEATKPGTKFSSLYRLNNEIAMGKLKELLIPIAAHFSERNMAKLITDTCKELIIVAKVKRRADREDKEKFHADVSGVTIS